MTHKEAVDDLNAIKAFFEQESGAYPVSLEYAINALKSGTKVVAQITFDEEKLYEIVKEAVERFKEEYEIADRPQEWIPCSERLPANDDWVIISVLDEVGDTPYRYSDFGWYLEAAKCWIVESEQRTDVVAWMPLPKPWKGADDETEMF